MKAAANLLLRPLASLPLPLAVAVAVAVAVALLGCPWYPIRDITYRYEPTGNNRRRARWGRLDTKLSFFRKRYAGYRTPHRLHVNPH